VWGGAEQGSGMVGWGWPASFGAYGLAH
jgi:hypothetical protein